MKFFSFILYFVFISIGMNAQWSGGAGNVVYPSVVSDLVAIGSNNSLGHQLRIESNLSSFKAGLLVDKQGNSFAQKNIALFTGYASDPNNIDGNANIGLWQRTNQSGNYATINFFNSNGALAGAFGVRYIDGGNTQFIISNRQGSNQVSPAIFVHQTGTVGIGTEVSSNPNDYKLAVNGKIGTKEVMVETSSSIWPDYVFEENYRLMDLTSLKQFIQSNQHLPEIPSKKEVGETGAFRVGEITVALLKKIEELTLYIIHQDEQIKELKNEIHRLAK